MAIKSIQWWWWFNSEIKDSAEDRRTAKEKEQLGHLHEANCGYQDLINPALNRGRLDSFRSF
jgi:hypothetical protein